jgi:hypothetical protein
VNEFVSAEKGPGIAFLAVLGPFSIQLKSRKYRYYHLMPRRYSLIAECHCRICVDKIWINKAIAAAIGLTSTMMV